jgi:hypothetical protein
MSAGELRVTYTPDEEWTGKIIATVQSGAFSAQGSAWFDRTHVKKTFLASLRSFPLKSGDLPTIEGGFWSKESQGSLDQCHLRISIKPHNARGTLLVHVDLASEFWKTPDVDLQNCATIRFLTEYAAVDRFAEQLEKVLDGESEEAVLKGITD